MTEVYGFDLTAYKSAAERQRQHERFLAIEGQLEDFNSQITIAGWKNIGALTADMLRTYEALYEVSHTHDAPAKDVAEKEPPTARYKHSQFLIGLGAFYRAVEDQVIAAQDEEQERQNLSRELKRMEECLDPDAIQADFLHFGIMKLLNMCDLYMGQIGFRGIDGAEVMTNMCLEYSGRFISLLSPKERVLWDAKVLQRQARLLFVAACSRGPSPGAPHAELPAEATDKYKEAGKVLRRAGAGYEYAVISQNL
ncbi:hypothetical protein B0T14DRAFT_559061 [Immersiella caudata]|uniref:Uncharacterized protein n=1 Tax=Immersiella caudata TaxID=314043 RepID=A0AA39XCR0_9PEZI|nr:hypothetical protein B0T14DRAFT_559061 [Immersiella caudata]